jgi:hypothetical protein
MDVSYGGVSFLVGSYRARGHDAGDEREDDGVEQGAGR